MSVDLSRSPPSLLQLSHSGGRIPRSCVLSSTMEGFNPLKDTVGSSDTRDRTLMTRRGQLMLYPSLVLGRGVVYNRKHRKHS
jgi:hypothetical protein